MMPKQYKSREEGHWKIWNFGQVTQEDLKKKDPGGVMIRGALVFAFFFGEEAGAHSNWDCVNGFSTKGML